MKGVTMPEVRWKEVDLDLQSQDVAAVQRGLDRLKLSDAKIPKDTSARLLSRCLEKLQSRDLNIRASAMAALAHQLRLGNPAMSPHAEELGKRLGEAGVLDLKEGKDGGEAYVTLHTEACFVIGALQVHYPRRVMPRFKPLAAYLVECAAQRGDPRVAGAGCGYWAKLEVPPVPPRFMDSWMPAVLTKLQKLVPALLNCMVYRDAHAQYMRQKAPSGEDGRQGDEKLGPEVERLSDMRNYAALAFENLCQIFQTEIVALVRPLLEQWLLGDGAAAAGEWQRVEAAVLAVGALTRALGTPREMADLYPRLVPRLLELYSHPEPLVRAITCFTMQHFVNYGSKAARDLPARMIAAIAALLDDDVTEVELMAMRGLAAILAYSQRDLASQTATLVAALHKGAACRGEARFVYYECVGHLFGRLGTRLADDDVTQLMEPIMAHWRRLGETGAGAGAGGQEGQADDVSDQVLLVCQSLCVIAVYGKSALTRYNEALFAKVRDWLRQALRSVEGPAEGGRSAQGAAALTAVTVGYLDVLSAVFDGQGPAVADLAAQYGLLELLLAVLGDASFQDKVHQSCLALLGHLCHHAAPQVRPAADRLGEALAEALGRRKAELIQNNALWALAGLAAATSDRSERLLALTPRLGDLLRHPDSDQGMATNAALALTTLAAKWPDDVIGVLARDDVFLPLCILLQMEFPRDADKATILTNTCAALRGRQSKQLPVDSWAPFCTALTLLDMPDEALVETLRAFLKDLRQTVGNNAWGKVTQQLGPQLAVTLRKRYKLY